MKNLIRIENSFVHRAVGQVRELTRQSKPTFEKVALLQFSAAEQVRKARRLVQRIQGRSIPESKTHQLRRLISLRLSVAQYYRDTARVIREQEERPNCLQTMPQPFATPRWGGDSDQPVESFMKKMNLSGWKDIEELDAICRKDDGYPLIPRDR